MNRRLLAGALAILLSAPLALADQQHPWATPALRRHNSSDDLFGAFRAPAARLPPPRRLVLPAYGTRPGSIEARLGYPSP